MSSWTILHSSVLFFRSAGPGGRNSLQWLPRGRVSGVPEARGIRAQERPAHINRSDHQQKSVHDSPILRFYIKGRKIKRKAALGDEDLRSETDIQDPPCALHRLQNLMSLFLAKFFDHLMCSVACCQNNRRTAMKTHLSCIKHTKKA